MAILIPHQCPNWNDLRWESAPLERAASTSQPLDIPQSPKTAGVYKMTWHDIDCWKQLPKQITVKASVRVQTPVLDISSLDPPVVLTIGRTTSIRSRIRQHFGTNRNNNRALMRIRQLIPDLDIAALLDIVCKNVKIEWVRIDNWVDRCLLEKSGVCITLPIFDLDAEH
jgi:hypothetical protein